MLFDALMPDDGTGLHDSIVSEFQNQLNDSDVPEAVTDKLADREDHALGSEDEIIGIIQEEVGDETE